MLVAVRQSAALSAVVILQRARVSGGHAAPVLVFGPGAHPSFCMHLFLSHTGLTSLVSAFCTARIHCTCQSVMSDDTAAAAPSVLACCWCGFQTVNHAWTMFQTVCVTKLEFRSPALLAVKHMNKLAAAATAYELNVSSPNLQHSTSRNQSHSHTWHCRQEASAVSAPDKTATTCSENLSLIPKAAHIIITPSTNTPSTPTDS